MKEEKTRILKMVQDGKITADDAMKLLDALDRTEARPTERELRRKWLHVRVEKDGRQTVNLKLPLALLKFGFKFAPRHARSLHRSSLRGAERARDRAVRAGERARDRAEKFRAKVERRLRDKLGSEADINLDGVFDDVIGELESEASSAPQFEMGTLGKLLDGDLDLERILAIASDPEFDGNILDVYDDDDGEHVRITLE